MSQPWTTEEQITEYTSQAHALLAAVDYYEEAHCDGAPCFSEALRLMKETLVMHG